MKELFAQVMDLLTTQEKRATVWLVAGMLIVGLLETVGLTPVLPFLAVLAKPEVIHGNSLLLLVYEGMGFSSDRAFLIFLGFVVLAAFTCTSAAGAWITWRCQRFSMRTGHELSARLFRAYMAQPYVYFLNQNTSAIQVDVIGRVFDLVTGVLMPALQVLSRMMLAVFIFLLLIIANPWLSLVAALVTGGGYVVAYLYVRRRIRVHGEVSAHANMTRGKFGAEALSGLKDVKVLGREDFFSGRYADASARYVNAQSKATFLGMMPRYVLEILAIGSMVGVVLVLLALEGNLAAILPLLALYAVSAYRLMPAMQQIFQGLALIKFNAGSVALLHRSASVLSLDDGGQAVSPHPVRALPFEREIRFESVTFRYPGAIADALESVSFGVQRNAHVGMVGATGSGKSTVLDLLLALLTPDAGTIRVDDVRLDAANAEAWRLNIGYVPQNIYLIDDTVTRNIAFGCADDEIDMARVMEAARQAQIHDFIVGEMAQGYATVVGERGTRLSGGQRQRIGIARALYRRPSVLILDEASSALDSVTERLVIESLKTLEGKTTILHVTHRLSTVRECNVVLFFSHGRLIGNGSFDELYQRFAEFRELAP